MVAATLVVDFSPGGPVVTTASTEKVVLSMYQFGVGSNFWLLALGDFIVFGFVTCMDCNPGLYTTKSGAASCLECGAGKFGDDEGCHNCPIGWHRNDILSIDTTVLTKCIICTRGQSSSEGAKSCQACGIGEYGSAPGNCTSCLGNTFQSYKGSTKCKDCSTKGLGYISNEKHTDCIKPDHLVPSDCDIVTQFLDDSSLEKKNHTCQPCPEGAFCKGNIGWSGIKALQGYWRVPWSKGNSTFARCPYEADCLGAPSPGGENIFLIVSIISFRATLACIFFSFICELTQRTNVTIVVTVTVTNNCIMFIFARVTSWTNTSSFF